MSKEISNMPLQPLPKPKPNPTGPIIQLTEVCRTFVNTLHTDEQHLHSQNTEHNNNNLPCQRHRDQYLPSVTYPENRPIAFKHMYRNEVSKGSLETRPNDTEMPRQSGEEKKQGDSGVMKGSSVYERLLNECKQKDKQVDQIMTEATFNPKELKSELSELTRHQSAENLSKKHRKQLSGSKPKQVANQRRRIVQGIKKLSFVVGNAKTKYQQILQQHFNQPYCSKKKQQYISVQDIRLTKLYGKNSPVLKLKDKLGQPTQHEFKSTRGQQNQAGDKREGQRVEKSKEPTLQQPRNPSKPRRCPERSDEKKSDRTGRQESESGRWMSMNFHERQQRVLSNRRERETIGKQKNMEKEIKYCTFKPELVNKSKSVRVLHNERQSYLEQYYERLHRRY